MFFSFRHQKTKCNIMRPYLLTLSFILIKLLNIFFLSILFDHPSYIFKKQAVQILCINENLVLDLYIHASKSNAFITLTTRIIKSEGVSIAKAEK